MAKLYETLPLTRQLELVVRANRPRRLARTFAGECGQFYDRARFDALAREVSALYEASSPEDAGAFRTRLDRRLVDRDRPPVAWQPGQPASRGQSSEAIAPIAQGRGRGAVIRPPARAARPASGCRTDPVPRRWTSRGDAPPASGTTDRD